MRRRGWIPSVVRRYTIRTQSQEIGSSIKHATIQAVGTPTSLSLPALMYRMPRLSVRCSTEPVLEAESEVLPLVNHSSLIQVYCLRPARFEPCTARSDTTIVAAVSPGADTIPPIADRVTERHRAAPSRPPRAVHVCGSSACHFRGVPPGTGWFSGYRPSGPDPGIDWGRP
jgi:hypothetical protein